jgi:hypothetical protein
MCVARTSTWQRVGSGVPDGTGAGAGAWPPSDEALDELPLEEPELELLERCRRPVEAVVSLASAGRMSSCLATPVSAPCPRH